MTTRTRRRLTAAALCTAGLVVAGAPLAAVAHNGRGHRQPSPRFHQPAYGQPGFTPGKAGSASLAAVLLGRNEIGPGRRHRGAGDPDGLGSVTVAVTKSNQVCAGLVVQGLGTPTKAYIQQAKGGWSGPIVIQLTPPAAGDPGASSICAPVDPGLAFDLRKHPDRYSVNVLTSDFPGGAVRGQLHRI